MSDALSFDLTGKVAIVTGGSRGLGHGMALGLARAGADVVVTSRRIEACQEVASQIRALGRQALAVATDVTSVPQINEMVKAVLDRFGKIDILINNAGVSPIYKWAVDVTEQDWDTILGTNLKGMFFCAQAVGKVMIQQKQGKVINVASVVAEEGSPRLAPYAAGKAAIVNLTRTLAVEWAPHNVHVNAVGPSYFEVGVSEPVLQSKWLSEMIVNRTPFKRVGRAEELAAVAVFLASDASSFVTGQTIFVDGGWLA